MATKQLKLSDFYSKKDHGHGNINKDGAIGSTANLPVITGASGKLQASSFGTAANTFCQGNDSRLSDSRVPVFNTVGASESAEKDLNTFKTGGFYYINSDAQAKHVDNCPLSKTDNISFFLLVETWGVSSAYYVKQTLTYYHNNKTYTRTCANQVWGPWDELKKTFDFVGMKGTDATVGYVKPLKFTIGKRYQDKPIEIEIYQRNRHEKCTVQVAFNNVSTNDPGINKLSHTGHNINIYLYKEGTGIWSLITSKGHAEKYGEMSVKISNPNTGINITRQDVHLASLPTSNLTTSTYIGFTQDEKTKLAGIATGANNYTHPNSGVTAGTNYNGNQTPSFGGTFNIPKLTFNAQGHITASANSTVTVPSLPTSSTSAAGIVKLNNNINSTSTTEAATANAVKTAYDKGNHSHPYISTTAGSVGTSNLASNAVTSEKIADSAVTNAKISNGAITSPKIADGAIGNQDIADNAIFGEKLFDYTITAIKLASNAVETAKIKDSNVTTAKIADSNITTAKIADSNVTTAKIANSAVTSAKIADGTIVNEDISSSAAIAYSKLSGVASSGHVHGWKTLKTYNENNKKITVRVNEKVKLAYVHVYYKTTTDYKNPPYIIDIATGSWFPVAGFANEFGATSHNAVLYYNYEGGTLQLKLIGAIPSGITIVGTMVFPYYIYDGEPA